MNENNKNIKEKSIGKIVAEKATRDIIKAAKKTKKSEKDAGLKKIIKHMEAGNKIEWRCGVCRAFIAAFQNKEDIINMREYLKVFEKKSYVPCPKNGKRHLNRFEIESDSIIFTTKLGLDKNEEAVENAKT